MPSTFPSSASAPLNWDTFAHAPPQMEWTWTCFDTLKSQLALCQCTETTSINRQSNDMVHINKTLKSDGAHNHRNDDGNVNGNADNDDAILLNGRPLASRTNSQVSVVDEILPFHFSSALLLLFSVFFFLFRLSFRGWWQTCVTHIHRHTEWYNESVFQSVSLRFTARNG